MSTTTDKAELQFKLEVKKPVVRRGDQKAWGQAFDLVKTALTNLNFTGPFTLVPLAKTRWMGKPDPAIRVGRYERNILHLTVKPPDSGNDGTWEYGLVTPPRKIEAVFKSMRAYLKPPDTPLTQPLGAALKKALTPEAPQPTAKTKPTPTAEQRFGAGIVEEVDSEGASSLGRQLVSRISKLEALAGRLDKRKQQIREIQQRRTTYQEMVQELKGRLVAAKEKLATLDTEELELEEANEQDKEAREAVKALETLHNLIGGSNGSGD